MSSASAAERARRLLSLLPLLAAGETRPLADLAVAVDATPEALAEDIVTLSMCGVPPYTPDALVSVFLDGGEVVSWAELPALSGPIRLSSEEATALTIALETAGISREAPLARALLEAAGPVEVTAETLRARIASGDSSILGAVARALEEQVSVRIRYLSSGSDAATERTVQPWSLTEHGGVWYLTAFCETVGAERTFRVDRIAEATLTEAAFVPPSDVRPYDEEVFARSVPDCAIVVFEAGEEVDSRDWPGAESELLPDGSVRLSIPVADRRWLARRVASRLGRARLVEPQDMQESVAAMANTLLEDATT